MNAIASLFSTVAPQQAGTTVVGGNASTAKTSDAPAFSSILNSLPIEGAQELTGLIGGQDAKSLALLQQFGLTSDQIKQFTDLANGLLTDGSISQSDIQSLISKLEIIAGPLENGSPNGAGQLAGILSDTLKQAQSAKNTELSPELEAIFGELDQLDGVNANENAAVALAGAEEDPSFQATKVDNAFKQPVSDLALRVAGNIQNTNNSAQGAIESATISLQNSGIAGGKNIAEGSEDKGDKILSLLRVGSNTKATGATTADGLSSPQLLSNTNDALANGSDGKNYIATGTTELLNVAGDSSLNRFQTRFTDALAQQASQQPANNPALPDQVSVKISNAINQGISRISIQLFPEELGKIDVQIDVAKNGSAQLTILAEKSDTLDMLQKDSRALERALADAGIEADSNSMEFSLKDQQDEAFAKYKQANNPYAKTNNLTNPQIDDEVGMLSGPILQYSSDRAIDIRA